MAIVIQHLTGPLTGKTHDFSDDVDSIAFGREKGRVQVLYPPEFTTVARRHLEIVRQASGDYQLHPFGDNVVAVNGKRVKSSTALKSGGIVLLGSETGPTFRLAIAENKSAGYLRTATQFLKTSTQDILHTLHSHYRGLRNAVIAVTVVSSAAVLVIALVIGKQGTEIAEIGSNVAEMHKGLESARAELQRIAAQQASTSFQPTDIEDLEKATYLVLLQRPNGDEDPIGTAWAYSDNALATNAHVVRAVNQQRLPGDRVMVRQAGPREFVVKDMFVHTGYQSFKSHLGALGHKRPDGQFRFVKLVSAYDVATITVAGKLPVWLDIAEDQDLLRINRGDPVAYLGYPWERIAGGEVSILNPEPQLHYGNITSLTDFFMLSAEAEHRLLIQHNLPATGGASGSPIVGVDGMVIGIHSGGNILTLESLGGEARLSDVNSRAPSAALINYGQRSDLLRALVDGRDGQQVTAHRVYWDRRAEDYFDRYLDHALAAFSEAGGANGVELPKWEGTLRPDAEMASIQFVEQQHTMQADPDALYGFMAYSESGLEIMLEVQHQGKVADLADGAAMRAPAVWVCTDSAAGELNLSVRRLTNAEIPFVVFGYRWHSPPSSQCRDRAKS